MLTAVEGVYRQGKVELSEAPTGIEESSVLVIFLQREAGDRAVSRAQVEPTDVLLKRIQQRMEQGIPLGGPPYPTREEIYEERLRRFK